MLTAYKGRTLKIGQRVKVYFNLHTHQFSVKDHKSGKVVAHGNNLILKDIAFKVSESGRQRVLREQKKNVHAYVIGIYVGVTEIPQLEQAHMKQAYYNPYKLSTFVDKDTQKPLQSADLAMMMDKQVYYL